MRFAAGLFSLLFLAALVAGACARFGFPFLPEMEIEGVPYPANPYVATTLTARHLWETGSLVHPRFSEIREAVRKRSLKEPGVEQRPDVYAVAADGTLWPKHCVLLSILAAPFYGALGLPGFWLFGQLLLFALFWAAYSLAARLTAPRPAYFACGLLLLFSSLFWSSTLAPSYDVLGAACLLGGLALLLEERAPFLTGLLWAASLSVRVTHGVLLPFFLLIAWQYHRRPPSRRDLGLVAGGFALGLAPLLAYHALVFHNPLSGAYGSIEYFLDGQSRPDFANHSFSLSHLSEHWRTRLWAGKDALLRGHPIWFALLLLPFTFRHRHWPVLCSLMLLAAGFAALMACFYFWENCGGPRFVYVSTVLMVLPLAFGLELLLDRKAAAKKP